MEALGPSRGGAHACYPETLHTSSSGWVAWTGGGRTRAGSQTGLGGSGQEVGRQPHAGPVPHQFLVTFKNGFESVQAESAPYLPGPLLRYTRHYGQVGAKPWQTLRLRRTPIWPCTARGLRGPRKGPCLRGCSRCCRQGLDTVSPHASRRYRVPGCLPAQH